MVLLDNPDYEEGLGMKIYVRTTIDRWFSFVESTAIQIGEDTLEIQAGFEERKYWYNGQEGSTMGKQGGDMPFSLGGHRVIYHLMSNYKSFQFKIRLDNSESHIIVRSVKGYLRVDIEHPTVESFDLSRGLMGSFRNSGISGMLARDGATVIEDANEFGQEWQVQMDEPRLFHNAQGPQHPKQCTMPGATTDKRHLGEGSITHEEAAKACDHITPSERNDCISDVISLQDIEIAGAY